MKPLDSSEGAVGGGSFDAEHGAAVRSIATSAEPAERSPDGGEPGGDEPEAGSESPAGTPHRVSQVVPRGTAEDEIATDEAEPARHSDVAPRSGASEPDEGVAIPPAPAAPAAEVPEPARETPRAPRYAMRELRAAARSDDPAVASAVAPPVDPAVTRMGPAFGSDDEDEATMVDAAAALSDAERALMARGPSTMAETQAVGTPLPAPLRPAAPTGPDRAVAVGGRHPFKQTMLLGLPRLEPPASAAAAAPQVAAPSARSHAAPSVAPFSVAVSSEAVPSAASAPAPEASSTKTAVFASLVRVVGPPTQPPPRRVRRFGSGGEGTVSGLSPADASELDHEAFVLTNPIGAADPARRSSVPEPPPSAAGSGPPASLSSLLPAQSARVQRRDPSSPVAAAPGVGSMSARSLGGGAREPSRVSYPPAPRSSYLPPERVSYPPSERISYAPAPRSSYPPPLRATIDPPAALSRTRPPMVRSAAQTLPPGQLGPAGQLLDELPMTDPFAGFVAPAPSVAQRWLVVAVVALAVVGLCSLAAIAFGLLGKTGW